MVLSVALSMSYHPFRSLLSALTLLFVVNPAQLAGGLQAAEEFQSLAGSWQVQLDPKIIGISQNWTAPEAKFDQSMQLPGTTDAAGLGVALSMQPTVSKEGLARLYRKNAFIGPVYYRRGVEIPSDWKGRHVTLMLERALWESQVWLDGKEIGKRNSLSTPHEFDLSEWATPGHHELVIRVDNRQQLDVGRSHAYIEDTQSIWNGIVGRIELRATAPVWIDRVRIEPDPAKASAEVRIGNRTEQAGEGIITGQITGPGIDPATAPKLTLPVKWDRSGGTVTLPLDAAKTLTPWSEFHPNLYQLSLKLESHAGGSDEQYLTVGFRKISQVGQSLRLNDLPIFLRGTHEGASFPLTGHPPMDVEGWRRIFKILKQWGLNHMRFHSYCPPDACFTAADEEGIYLQAELPLWVGDLGRSDDKVRCSWVREEARRIMESYGNHPSLVLFSLGNELHGQYNFLQQFLGELKTADPRRLYTMTSNRLWVFDAPEKVGETSGPSIVDDFLVERAFRKDGKLEGMRGQSFFNEMPNTCADFSKILERTSLPLITHEIGQWNVFPNLSEIPKYTGVLRPLNLEAIRDDLASRGLLAQAGDFTRASGKFCAELYKQELELALRSRSLAGYQLLDLHDYPGQGTAHVGLLDSFWDSKGVADPAWFRDACAPVVPLLRVPKRVYTRDEQFSATVEFVNFSEKAIPKVTPRWEITAPGIGIIAQGCLPQLELPLGAGIAAGQINASFGSVTRATEACLSISASEAGARNFWKIWILPSSPAVDARQVLVTTSLSEATRALQSGGKVLYSPTLQSIRQRQDTAFLPAFWSPVYFTNQAGTMGLLIQNEHPALADFPTAEHSDWQWWSILTPSPGAVVLDQVNYQAKPIVQVIDAFSRNQKLGLIFEAKVGAGQLLVCAADIVGKGLEDPMRRQLRASLVHYLEASQGKNLAPLSQGDLERLFREDTSIHDHKAQDWSKDLEPPPVKK